MQRISGTTVEVDKFGAGKNGFSEGNGETQRPATIVSAAFLDALQEEIVRAIEQSGQTPDPANLNQLAQAIAQAAASGPSAPPGTDPTALRALVNEWTAANSWTAPAAFKAPLTIEGVAADGVTPNYVRATAFRTHKKLIPLSAIWVWNGTGSAMHDDDGLAMYKSSADPFFPAQARLDLNAFVPRGAQITAINAGVRTSTVNGTARMSMKLQRHVLAMTGDGGANVKSDLFTSTASKNADAILGSPAMAVTVTDSALLRLFWQGNINATAADPDRIRWIQITYAGWFADEYD